MSLCIGACEFSNKMFRIVEKERIVDLYLEPHLNHPLLEADVVAQA